MQWIPKEGTMQDNNVNIIDNKSNIIIIQENENDASCLQYLCISFCSFMFSLPYSFRKKAIKTTGPTGTKINEHKKHDENKYHKEYKEHILLSEAIAEGLIKG